MPSTISSSPKRRDKGIVTTPAEEYRRLTNPLHRIAARLRFLLNPKGYGWAANGDWER